MYFLQIMGDKILSILNALKDFVTHPINISVIDMVIGTSDCSTSFTYYIFSYGFGGWLAK